MNTTPVICSGIDVTVYKCIHIYAYVCIHKIYIQVKREKDVNLMFYLKVENH